MPLHVLIVEDSLSDALDLLRELEEGGYEPVHTRVDRADALNTALDQQKWDIVIADHEVQGFLALDALELIKQKGLKLPFIVTIDLISDDVAVSAVQAGVEEIIMKSNLSRLVPAVERILGDRREERSEQRPAQETLKESMGRLLGLIESSTEAIISTNREGELVLFNRGAEIMLGYQLQEVIGHPLSVLCESAEQVQEMLRQMKEGGSATAFETVLRAKDGGPVPVMLSASILFDEDGQEAGIVGFCEDIRERKKAEETKQRFARQKAAAAQFVSLVHREVDVQDLMDAAAMLTAEALGVEYCDVFELEDSVKSFKLVSGVGWASELVGSATVSSGTDSVPGYTLAEKKPVIVEDLKSVKRFKGPSLLKDHGVVSGLSVPMVSGEFVFGVMGAHSTQSRDFSDDDINFLEAVAGLLVAAVLRKRAKEELQRASEKLSEQVKSLEQAQEQLIRAEKLAVVDRLAAGVSHEILNPLNIISLRLQMMNKDPSLPPDMIRHLQALEEQASRITKNIRDLLYYARKRSPEYRQVDLNETVTRSLDIVEGDLGTDNITLELRLTEGLPPVLADSEQLRQVVLNLLNNAREAMPGGGKLVLSTGSVQSNGQNFVEFRVKDTGEGVAPEDLDRLFDPFFTTKQEGEGAGLGLYLCQSIIEAHGGTIKAESEKGSGTTVAFQLPLGHDKENAK
jgi:PAS domain S-box-containing protein